MADAEVNDILGTVIFLLSMEWGEPHYDPLAQEGYVPVMGCFQAVTQVEQRRRDDR